MKKLSMKLDDLRVESFSVDAEKTVRRGTVRGNLDISQMCLTPGCGGTDPYDTKGCTFTADIDCMESANCP